MGGPRLDLGAEDWQEPEEREALQATVEEAVRFLEEEILPEVVEWDGEGRTEP